MYNNRIFQHYEGDVPIHDMRFSEFKVIGDRETEAPIILWFKEASGETWYRIFIDSLYCVIDTYRVNHEIDRDEDAIVIKDYSDFVKQKELKEAVVKQDNEKEEIALILTFKDNSRIEFISTYEGDCRLNFT